jgi:hypothetical protein
MTDRIDHRHGPRGLVTREHEDPCSTECSRWINRGFLQQHISHRAHHGPRLGTSWQVDARDDTFRESSSSVKLLGMARAGVLTVDDRF